MSSLPAEDRLHALDAVRAFALLLGIAFHAAMSFIPGMPPIVWAIADNSPSSSLASLAFVAHIFRMSLFFLIAGFFARLLLQRRGTRGFWSNRLRRILVPLIVGWLILFPAIAAVWTWGISETFAGAGPPPAMPTPPPGWFPLTHLWFLYELLLLYVAVLVLRRAVIAIDGGGRIRAFVDTLVRGSLRGYWAALLLGLPLAACLYSLDFWVFFQSIPTPDSSLLPQLAPSVGFGTAFIFGWLIHRQLQVLSQIQQRWLGHLVIALAATAVCLWIIGSRPVLTPVPAGNERLVFALSLCVALWGWVFAITGIGLRFFSSASPARRYVADSSYWLYLAHLPIVAALQVLVAKWPLHWSVKYPLVLAASFAILFASYHYLVRPTGLGGFLNGRKYPRRSKALATPSGERTAPALPDGPVAELIGATKRYGKVIALDGVDLQVKRGELLAVLGPNGAGKSTAIGLWLGLIQPDSGAATLGGGSPLDVDRRRKVGVMMQEVELPRDLRVRELIALTASYYLDPLTPREAMELTRTTALADRLYGKLSGGQKRQVQFALAVCGRPEVLFLDEPTVGLDVQARETMWATINELIHQGCSIVLTTHYLEEAEALADRVVVLAKSRVIASGSVDEMRSIVSRKQITCQSSLSADEIRAWPGVVEVIHDTNRLRITAVDAEGVVRQLLASDPALRSLEVRQAGLTEAFTHLTQEAA
jgi:ABC-type multidrug transport system ATPase subunit/peptidoglycan/LPS O-acetylase OafA/YrhL